MRVIELSLLLSDSDDPRTIPLSVETRNVPLTLAGKTCRALIHDFHFGSMCGTYIDFPGHIVETDNGVDAANAPPAAFYRLPAACIRLDRDGGSGAVSAAELQAALSGGSPFCALIVNALGHRRFDSIEARSVFLSRDAVDWIAALGVRLLISDVYECRTPIGVFSALFAAGICTVCAPASLELLPAARCRVTVTFPAIPGATQVPCRVFAELEE